MEYLQTIFFYVLTVVPLKGDFLYPSCVALTIDSLTVDYLQTSFEVLTMAQLTVDYLHRRKQPFPALTTKNRPLLCTEEVL